MNVFQRLKEKIVQILVSLMLAVRLANMDPYKQSDVIVTR